MKLRRTDEARRATVYALDLPADDPTTTDFRVWLAFEEAIEGRTDRAQQLLSQVDEDDLDDVPRILFAFTTGLVAVRQKGRAAFAEARERGQAAVRQYAPKAGDSDLSHSYRRWARRLAQDAGGIAAWFWATFQGRVLPGA